MRYYSNVENQNYILPINEQSDAAYTVMYTHPGRLTLSVGHELVRIK